MKREEKIIDLWKIVNCKIESNFELKENLKFFDWVKEVAKATRKEIKRLGFKASVRVKNHEIINIDILEGIFDKESEEYKYIVNYINKYVQSYRGEWKIYIRITTSYEYKVINNDKNRKIVELFKKNMLEEEEEEIKRKLHEEKLRKEKYIKIEKQRQEDMRI